MIVLEYEYTLSAIKTWNGPLLTGRLRGFEDKFQFKI